MQSVKTKVTKLGVLIDHGMVMEQVKDLTFFNELSKNTTSITGIAEYLHSFEVYPEIHNDILTLDHKVWLVLLDHLIIVELHQMH